MKIAIALLILVMTFSCKNEKQPTNINSNQINDTISKIEHKADKIEFEENLYYKYCNVRYDFCIDYPKNFISQGESYNGDGQVFISKDKKAQISTFGSMSLVDVTPTIKHVFDMSNNDKRITYKVLKKDYFIVSGFNENGDIFYQKTLSKKVENSNNNNQPDFYQTLMITYPKNQSDIYAEYCKKIARFF
ncbi:hypothetical protein FLGE108171_14595 [Flavobacterium gelidilacus]|uniref:hypothetical protein n=1 Tax=Flavobacterium gelidilacus TaxID=206041 RepID=UPI0003F54337|nr:hypothetical protein [Flavobacterium gelidilacus]